MCDGNKTLRIDWFDGTVIEETRPNTSQVVTETDDNPQAQTKPLIESEKKAIGFKKLLDLSLLKPPILNVEIANRPGFWLLLDIKVKDDFLVLLVKIIGSLYKSTQPDEKSKIVNLLRSKFESSDFITILKEYIIKLPNVRISQKKINSLLWNDAESFFYSILELCDGIFNFGGHEIEFLSDIHELLELTETSAVGVQEEHAETISDRFYRQLNDLRSKISDAIHEIPRNVEDNISVPENKDPNYYKNLSIFPTKDDLLSKNKIKIVPNIINGAYPSIDHYLDLQFKLLREDCFGPLREGISKYSENPTKRRYENIRIYPKVRIICNHISSNRIGYLVDLAWNERVNHWSVDCQKYASNKQLMFGSLLLFTSDNFQTILCASVLDSSLQLLEGGYIAVSFQSPVSDRVFFEQYLMIESEVYFEPYHRVLKVLQESKIDDLPMKKYIIDVMTETQPPAYFNSETLFSINDKKYGTIYFPVLEPAQWPNSSLFNLDESQMDAFKLALTREFAVIQGPPGTGKTYMGIKIASMILKNVSLEGTPMLVICYTNQALDQFLEGILKVTKSVIRMGSQSKSEILEQYNLYNLKSTVRTKYSYLYGSKKAELEIICKQIRKLNGELEKCQREILSYKTIKPFLKINEQSYELKTCKEDPVLDWLFGHLEDEDAAVDESEDWEKRFEDINVTDQIITCFSEEWAMKEIGSMLNSIKYVNDITDEHVDSRGMIRKFENQINKTRKRLNYFKKQISLQLNKKDGEINRVDDLYNLTPDQRWSLYYDVVEAVKKKIVIEINLVMVNHKSCCDSLDEVSTMIDSEIMRTARVVGVTTTVAARRHDLMRKLMSPIVIVEEAAEVLEAHIVASLTLRCQHLILIGDHKQLKPSAAHYILARDYNLEVSLFERMIRNGVHARTLSTQRRMRPNFVSLLVPAVYERLDCHPSVREYPAVKGMKDTMYFYTHQVPEDTEGLEDSWSHKNTFEAKWCVSLAYYLRKMKYGAHEITILTTYNEQATLIKELSKRHAVLNNVTVTVVDNYQGKENRIVILSLVRSNRHGRIGFLSTANRVCVALSRAREGFYMFGNMNCLRSSSLWRQISGKLETQQAIGDALTLHCDKHNTTLSVKRSDDFAKCIKGTCLKVCGNV